MARHRILQARMSPTQRHCCNRRCSCCVTWAREAAADKVQKALETVYAERKTLTRDVGGTAGTTQFADAVLQAMG